MALHPIRAAGLKTAVEAVAEAGLSGQRRQGLSQVEPALLTSRYAVEYVAARHCVLCGPIQTLNQAMRARPLDEPRL
jgi:hypothetical protein